jgi:hypothetical protein
MALNDLKESNEIGLKKCEIRLLDFRKKSRDLIGWALFRNSLPRRHGIATFRMSQCSICGFETKLWVDLWKNDWDGRYSFPLIASTFCGIRPLMILPLSRNHNFIPQWICGISELFSNQSTDSSTRDRKLSNVHNDFLICLGSIARDFCFARNGLNLIISQAMNSTLWFRKKWTEHYDFGRNELRIIISQEMNSCRQGERITASNFQTPG